jgi:hypothetical protein
MAIAPPPQTSGEFGKPATSREQLNPAVFPDSVLLSMVSDPPCETKTSHVAYLLEVELEASLEEPTLYIDVTDENITAQENANPVVTLRMRYDAARPRPEL